jgi:hypothetical protein
MGKVTFNAAQVLYNPTYNWSPVDPTIGMLDIGYVSTDAPGPGPASPAGAIPPGLQDVAVSVLPRAVYQPQLGQIIRAWDPVLGFGEFIYLAVPLSTAIPLGTLVTWDVVGGLVTNQSASNPLGGGSQYSAVIVPVKGTSQKSGVPVAVCVASTVYNSGNGIASNASAIQYAWFQCGGQAQILKTNVQLPPVTSITATNGVYISGTAGRVYGTFSSGGQILGARFANTVTVTTVASCVLVYLNGRPELEGG